MNRRFHARLARQLIEACGGLEEAMSVCRVGRSQLSDSQVPHGVAFLPADVIHDLEQHCGQTIYSRALYEARPAAIQVHDLREEVSEATEAVADLQREVRLATRDGVLTPNEQERLARKYAEAEAQLRDVGALINAGNG